MHEHGAAACGLDGLDRLLSAFVVAIHDHDGRAFRGEEERRFPADAAAGARDEGHFALEPSRHTIKSVRNIAVAPSR